jgi:hypothetical protein
LIHSTPVSLKIENGSAGYQPLFTIHGRDYGRYLIAVVSIIDQMTGPITLPPIRTGSTSSRFYISRLYIDGPVNRGWFSISTLGKNVPE